MPRNGSTDTRWIPAANPTNPTNLRGSGWARSLRRKAQGPPRRLPSLQMAKAKLKTKECTTIFHWPLAIGHWRPY
eukprot:scaffold176372_cov25-Tisochrysis_lutea.AAC.4